MLARGGCWVAIMPFQVFSLSMCAVWCVGHKQRRCPLTSRPLLDSASRSRGSWSLTFITDPCCAQKRLEAMNTPWRLDPDRKKRTSFGLGYNIATCLNKQGRCLHSMLLVVQTSAQCCSNHCAEAKSLIALYPDEPIDPEYLNPGSSGPACKEDLY